MYASSKKAREKYRKEKCKAITVTFCPPEMNIYEYIEKHCNGSKCAFIKSCIKEKMAKEK
jgi:hypothetical protein